jgi:hypothetical protein
MNKFKLLEAIIGKSSESLILNPDIQANMLKISNKHDKITKRVLISLVKFLIIIPPNNNSFYFLVIT